MSATSTVTPQFVIELTIKRNVSFNFETHGVTECHIIKLKGKVEVEDGTRLGVK
jgi:hypothetical protein